MGQLEQAYRTLELKPGASLDEIKQARRKLALKWHPDRHSSNQSKLAEAETRFKEINAAYSYLKRIKATSARRNQSSASGYRSNSSTATKKKKQTRKSRTRKENSKQNSRKQTNHHSSSSNTSSSNKKTKEFDQTWFDRLLTRITNWRLQYGLDSNRDRKIRKMYKRLNKERKRWSEAKEKFHNNTRIGVYSSMFNALVFGKLEQSRSSDQQTTSLGGYNAQNKYDIILRHSIIRDHIFYAFNRGLNLFFKYTLCILFISQILFLIYQNYRWGIFWGEVWEFVGNQSLVFSMLAVLFLPDNLYQRYLLWNYRNLSIKKVRKLFKDKRLPQPHEYYKNWMLVGKYTMISGLIWMFF